MTSFQQQKRQFRRDGVGQYTRNMPWNTPRETTVPGFRLIYAGDEAAQFVHQTLAAIEKRVGPETNFARDGEKIVGSFPRGGIRTVTPAPTSEGARYGFVLAGAFHSVRIERVFRFDGRWKVRAQFINGPQTAVGNPVTLALSWQQFRRLPGLIQRLDVTAAHVLAVTI